MQAEMAVEMLLRAKAAVEAVRRGLNDTTVECPCCGLKKATDWDEAQLAKELDATISRLEKHTDKIRGQLWKLAR